MEPAVLEIELGNSEMGLEVLEMIHGKPEMR